MPNDFIVEILLPSTHTAPDDRLGLLWQLRLHIFLESSQKERSQHCMQFLQYFLTDWEVLLQSLLERDVEPLVEVVEGVEYLRHQEVKQGPQFSKIVLQRGTG